MKEKAKVYLDTSVISALFDSRTPERQQLTKLMWELLKDYNVYISEIVTEELDAVSEDRRKSFYAAVEGFSVLRVTDEIKSLATEYVRQGIFPETPYYLATSTPSSPAVQPGCPTVYNSRSRAAASTPYGLATRTL